MYLTVIIGNKNSQMFLCYIMEYEITSSSNWSWVLREELLRRRCLGVFEDKNSSFGGEGMFLTTKTPPPENMNVFDYKNSFFIKNETFVQNLCFRECLTIWFSMLSTISIPLLFLHPVKSTQKQVIFFLFFNIFENNSLIFYWNCQTHFMHR